MEQIVVFSDLDGTLLDPVSYSCTAAEEAVTALRARGVPLVLVSSKTRAEMEPIRVHLENHDPFTVENGGGLYIPTGYFDFEVPSVFRRDPYHVVEFGTPYQALRRALSEIGRAVGGHLRGFGDMSPDEIRDRTGLSGEEAGLAKQREFDEPFVIEPTGAPLDHQRRCEEVIREAQARGLRVVRGGGFFHLTGNTDKGEACRVLIECYRRRAEQQSHTLFSIGIGDSPNDLPMLALTDCPVAVQMAGGSYDPALQLPNLTRAPGVGPVGWNHAILSLFRDREGSR